MKVLLKPGVIDELQKKVNKNDQEFAEYIGVSRSQLWRVKLPSDDKRFSLGQDFIAKLLNRFSGITFEEVFFLDNVSHACYTKQSVTKEVV